MESLLVLVCALVMLAGLAGVVVPALPGLPLCLGAVVGWAVLSDAGWPKWVVVALAVVWFLLGVVAKYALAGRRLKRAGIPTFTMLSGVVLGVVGMFVIPVVGLFVGFVAGVWLAEAYRHRGFSHAWPSAVHALKAAGLAVLVELAAGLLIAATWAAGVVGAAVT